MISPLLYLLFFLLFSWIIYLMPIYPWVALVTFRGAHDNVCAHNYLALSQSTPKKTRSLASHPPWVESISFPLRIMREARSLLS